MSDTSEGKNRYTLTWEIDNFYLKDLTCFDSHEIRSPLFIADNLGRSAWFLTIKYLPSYVTQRAECSIVRYSKDEGIEEIPIQFMFSVTSDGDLISPRKVKDDSSVFTFKKGYSFVLCNLEQYPIKSKKISMILKCQMTEFSTVECPISSGSTIQSMFIYIDWISEGLSDVKLISCSQGVQYEVFFHVINDTVLVRIRRADRNSSIRCYMSGHLFSTFFGPLPFSRESRLPKSFNVNDTLDMSTTFIKDTLSEFKFESKAQIDVLILNSVVTDIQSSFLEGKLAEITTGHELDSLDVWRKEQLRMYEDGIHSDVQLQIGSKSIQAHKCVLASRSPVFSAMLEGGMIEQQTGVVHITDMDASTLDALLKYMYGAVVEELEYENALKLLVAADKYQVMSLREKCIARLLECLTVENVCEVLALADMVSHPALKSKAVDYVKVHAKEVLLSDSWKQFVRNNFNLASEIVILISGEYGQNE